MSNVLFARRTWSSTVGRTAYSGWLRYFWFGVAISLGAIYTWIASINHSMNADGISYLDMGDAYLRGDWEMAINSVWSPMYAWVVGLVLRLVNPTMQWEFPIVQLVNFVIYLVTLLCFAFFWRQIMRYHLLRTSEGPEISLATFPEWALLTLGYMLFITSSLFLIEIWSVTPDMLMAASIYVAAGLVVRLRLGSTGWNTFILLGFVLGLGYLVKGIMFPVAFLFLAISLFSVSDLRLAVPRVSVAALAFLVISLPFIAIVSQAKGKMTIGDAGAFTYAKHVNGIPFAHWQGETPGNGTPVHPTRKILETPPIYEFGAPIGGTYPVSYDPSYWHEGLETNFDLSQQIDALVASSLFYIDVFFRQYGGLVFGVLLLYLLSRWAPLRLVDILAHWGLVLVALAVFAFYGMVNVAGRYVGVFVVLFWADLFANVRLSDANISRLLMRYTSLIMIAFLVLNILLFNVEGYRDLNGIGEPRQVTNTQVRSPSWPGEVAERLQDIGIEPGDRVAVIGYAFDSYWARLARVKIVAEMTGSDAEAFWIGNSLLKTQVIEAFAGTGADAIVAENVPSYASLANWQQINDTNYYVYILSPSE